jgi:membrane-associated protein
MSPLPDPEALILLGPAVLFVMTFAETAVPAGFLVPAGVALALGSFLAHQGVLGWEGVILSAAAGGLLGDSTGYWLGRRGSGPFRSLPGRLGRALQFWERSSRRIFRGPTLVAVSLARTASFVRTLMPTSAGMSGMGYPRFLVYDVTGVALWLALYVSVGILAGESWRVASGVVGGGWALIFTLVALVAWIVSRRRRRRSLLEELAMREGLVDADPDQDGAPEGA